MSEIDDIAQAKRKLLESLPIWRSVLSGAAGEVKAGDEVSAVLPIADVFVPDIVCVCGRRLVALMVDRTPLSRMVEVHTCTYEQSPQYVDHPHKGWMPLRAEHRTDIALDSIGSEIGLRAAFGEHIEYLLDAHKN